MEESSLAKTRRFFIRNEIVFRLSIILLLAAVTTYAFIFGNALLKIITVLSISVMLASFFSNYIFKYFYGEGYKIMDVINEIWYVFFGVPLMLICVGYLPLSVYVLFFSTENNRWILPIIFVVMVILQVFAFIMILRGRAKEHKKSIKGYIRHVFDFKSKAEEQKRFVEQTEQIDNFYSDMEKVKERVDEKMKASTSGLGDYEWKKERGIKQVQESLIVCWNCRKNNDTGTKECIACKAPLRRGK